VNTSWRKKILEQKISKGNTNNRKNLNNLRLLSDKNGNKGSNQSEKVIIEAE